MDFVVTILYLWLTLFLQCGALMEHRISKRLVGSVEVKSINEVPYIAYIERPKSYPSFCAGAIISEYWVLTVANCVVPRDPKMVVRVGSVYQHQGSSHPVIRMIAHPKYKRTPAHLKNNIAVLQVRKSLFSGNPNVRAIALGKVPDESGIWVQTAGWGCSIKDADPYNINNPSSKRLRKLTYQTMDSVHCRKIHDQMWNVVSPTEICAYGGLGKATCTWDEGDPLITLDKKRLVGINSGYQTCRGDYPGLFTRIAYFIHWIRRVTRIRFSIIA